MPGDFERVDIAFGMAASPTTVIDTFPGASFTIVPKTSYNTVHYFRFRAVDTSGNFSPWSAQATAIPVPLVDVDVILSAIDAANTIITNIGSESIKSGAILSTNLANNAVTQAKLATSVSADIAKGIADAFTAQGTANTAAGNASTALTTPPPLT